MIEINAPDELRKWYEVRQKTLQKDAMTAQLKLPNAPNLNKATAAFETRTHVASVTVWGTGMVEFIVLDLATNQEAIVSDTECESVESLWQLLDDHIRDFLALVRQLNGEAL